VREHRADQRGGPEHVNLEQVAQLRVCRLLGGADMTAPGVVHQHVDRGSAVAEDLSDADLVEDDAGRAEGGEPVIGVGAEPGGGGGLADVFRGGVTVTVDGCGVGGDFEQRAVHG
jgi:hypothetical protein